MANFDQHIQKVRENIDFLNQIRTHQPRNLNWEVTVCYYIAVHLVNAHIAIKGDLHPRTHKDTKKLLDYGGSFVNTRLPEDVYLNFISLTSLTRFSRYMYDLQSSDTSRRAFINENKNKRKL